VRVTALHGTVERNPGDFALDDSSGSGETNGAEASVACFGTPKLIRDRNWAVLPVFLPHFSPSSSLMTSDA